MPEGPQWWHRAAKSLAFQLIGALAAALLLTGLGYKVGEIKGEAAGREAARIAMKEQFENKQIEMYKELEDKRIVMEKALNEREKKLRQRMLAEIENERRIRNEEDQKRRIKQEENFNKTLETKIYNKFRNELLKAQEQGHAEGEELGYERGLEKGKTDCFVNCQERINNLNDHGELWLEFYRQVESFSIRTPMEESEIERRARTIVQLAKDGRRAAQELAGVLNGQIDEINRALDNKDYQKVRNLIQSFADTLSSKNTIWRRNFRRLMLNKGS